MANRKVEFLESVKVREGDFVEGDVKTLPKERADKFIASGWAKCCDTGEVGERVPGAEPMAPADVVTPSV